MNRESNPAEYCEPLADEVPSLLGSPLGAIPVESPTWLATSTPSADPGFDDAVDCKAPTLNIDIPAEAAIPAEVARNPSEWGDRSSVSRCPFHYSSQYIQGIAHDDQVYIITNLMHGVSQAVIQPQRVWTIGRNREVALPIRDKAMSRRHAVVRHVQDAGFYLVDLNSMNGSYVNGVRIKHRLLLKDGDRIQIGNTKFTFFQSHHQRCIDALHPEVWARLTASKSAVGTYVDFLTLD